MVVKITGENEKLLLAVAKDNHKTLDEMVEIILEKYFREKLWPYGKPSDLLKGKI